MGFQEFFYLFQLKLALFHLSIEILHKITFPMKIYLFIYFDGTQLFFAQNISSLMMFKFLGFCEHFQIELKFAFNIDNLFIGGVERHPSRQIPLI